MYWLSSAEASGKEQTINPPPPDKFPKYTGQKEN